MDRRMIANPELLDAAIKGLSADPKQMEPKWFYDETGSALFERITELPEYYPTRTETAILRDHCETIAGYVPDGAELVELGSGASVKTRILLDCLDRLAVYVPLDISAEFLDATARDLAAAYPGLDVTPVVADFTRPVDLPDTDRARVGFFPGSTLGNLTDSAAHDLLTGARAWDRVKAFVLGIDLVKSPETLVAAYDDAQGVTAEFNLNLLRRMNREVGANFDISAFSHRAIWNAEEARIEMHIVSTTDQQVDLGERSFRFATGETIHTENSRKFTPGQMAGLAEQAGWSVSELLYDADENFAVAVLTPA